MNPSGSKDSMDNSGEAKDAQKQQDKNQQSGNNQGGGKGSGDQNYSAEYKAGWNKAMEDYKAGKLKL
jgi:hypothetical protein